MVVPAKDNYLHKSTESMSFITKGLEANQGEKTQGYLPCLECWYSVNFAWDEDIYKHLHKDMIPMNHLKKIRPQITRGIV